MAVMELCDPSALVSPSPSRERFAKKSSTSSDPYKRFTPWGALTPAYLFAGLVVATAYALSGWNHVEPAFIGVSLASFLTAAYLSFYSKSYDRYTARNALDIDAYCGHSPGFLGRAYLAFMHRITSHAISREAARSSGDGAKFKNGLPLKVSPSPYVKGLLVTSRRAEEDAEAGPLPLWPAEASPSGDVLPMIVGTIRMGFGHHRIAYSACSWAQELGCQTYFHDLLGIESREAQLIRDADKLYSKGSRLASEVGGVVEQVWGMLTLSGSENSLRQSWQMAEGLIPVMMAMDKKVPVIASHSLVGMVAVACGFETVVNCVIDNHAQWFVVVPGALNLVQGPGNLFKLRALGVPHCDVRVAGHWCPADMVNGIPEDCGRRLALLKSELDEGIESLEGSRRTFLVPIGGAGAQRRFVISLVKAVISSGLLQEGAQLILNAGDHVHMKEAFEEILAGPGAPAHETISTLEAVREAAADPAGLKTRPPVILCAFEEYFSAVAATDILCRAVDVLACKPSEMAFYPLPKLMIRRVGDHEQFSAIRAYELGDGTREIREVPEALEWMRLMLAPGSDLLAEMNRRVIANNSIGVYDGCKNAVKWAKEMATNKRQKA